MSGWSSSSCGKALPFLDIRLYCRANVMLSFLTGLLWSGLSLPSFIFGLSVWWFTSVITGVVLVYVLNIWNICWEILGLLPENIDFCLFCFVFLKSSIWLGPGCTFCLAFCGWWSNARSFLIVFAVCLWVCSEHSIARTELGRLFSSSLLSGISSTFSGALGLLSQFFWPKSGFFSEG